MTLAIGSPGNYGNGGHVGVLKYSNSTWSQVSFDIDGEASGDLSGKAVSLSSDGLTLAIGADCNDGNGDNSGHVRVFKYLK